MARTVSLNNNNNNTSIKLLRDVHLMSRSSTGHGLIGQSEQQNNTSITQLRDVRLMSRGTAGLQSSNQCKHQRSIIKLCAFLKVN